MTSKERFTAILNFKRPDRLPMIEWAGYWNKTISRWMQEGLPEELKTSEEIRTYFGLDELIQKWIVSKKPDCPRPTEELPLVRDESDYKKLKEYLYPESPFNPEELKRIGQAQEERGIAFWFTLDGFFWFPRQLFGIEGHLYAFFDHPKLMKQINEDNLTYILKVIEGVCQYVEPQFMTFAEDLSYNNGAMLSKDMFDEFLAPCYKDAINLLKSKGIKIFVDTDGLVDEPVDWYTEIGFDGFLPLEKQAGVNLIKYRKKHPDLLLIGGYDKMCMSKGEEAMQMEFERLLPVMQQGGYVPSVDHQTPPEVSMENYRIYLRLLKEYCIKAVV